MPRERETPEDEAVSVEARKHVLNVMCVSHPMTCAGITSKGPVQANGMCRHFLNRERCDCPPENSAESRLAAFESAVRASERAAVVRIVEGELARFPNHYRRAGTSVSMKSDCLVFAFPGPLNPEACDCGKVARDYALNTILAALRAAPTTPET